MDQHYDNDSITNIAIRCIDKLVVEGYIKDCSGTDDMTEFEVQDIIKDEIQKSLVRRGLATVDIDDFRDSWSSMLNIRAFRSSQI
tara:strand:+ start:4279 stop:4533 length:255 start_codon:yes stop_codon:yes gene_type:complete